MISPPPPLSVPLRTEDDGTIRIGDTRVLLEVVIGAHLRGDTPEQIVAGFPTLKLADVYAVIAYYLSHRDEVDEYIQQVEREGERIRQEVEANYTPEQKARTEYFRALLDQKRREQDS